MFKDYIEDDSTPIFNWLWSGKDVSGRIALDETRKKVTFNIPSSNGTTAVRGEEKFISGYHHFWEIKPENLYGTDFIIGIGTSECNLNAGRNKYCSLVGLCKNSWGFSFHGRVHHNGVAKSYGKKWPKGGCIGIHLDSYHGTLEFYLNRQPLGIAFRNLGGRDFYPLVCSTSSRSRVTLKTSFSFLHNLQFMSYAIFKQTYGSAGEKALAPGLCYSLYIYEIFFRYIGYYTDLQEDEEQPDEQNIL